MSSRSTHISAAIEPNTKALHELSIAEAGAALRAGETTASELTEHALARIAALDPLVRSFILVTADRARDDAARADRELASGLDRGPLHGIPYALKDIYDTAGIATTCNSKRFIDRIPSADAAAVTKMTDAGAVLLGKLNTHEFALGGPGDDLPFPPARNPWNIDHFTGGSSSGSGAAVAAGFVRIALGSDTGGSIRSPACHCGVVGLKPTYGLVSRRGVYPLSYALDHCGPLTWNVEEAALVMNAIAGYDPLDPSSVDVAIPDHTKPIGDSIHGVRIGYARTIFDGVPGVSPEVLAAMDDAAQTLARLGAIVEEVVLPDFEVMKACGRVIMLAEAYAIHEKELRERPYDYGAYTYERIAAASGLTAADLTQAFRLRRELTVVLNHDVLSRYHALITTTSLAPAARLDEFPAHWPAPSIAVAVQTAAFNVTGNPALAMPIAFSKSGLPLGMQIVARPFDESMAFRIGSAFEAAVGITHARPSLGSRGS